MGLGGWGYVELGGWGYVGLSYVGLNIWRRTCEECGHWSLLLVVSIARGNRTPRREN